MNWVGGARNRLKSSLQSERKVQKMSCERKQYERSSSTLTSRHPSDIKISKLHRKNSISQDILSFKMQSEISSKNDINNGHNFRVVNLGPTRQVQATKKGIYFNGNRTRSVEIVHLPVSPIETPSTLNLSGSPASCGNNNIPNLTSFGNNGPTSKAVVPYNQFTDSKNSSLNKHNAGSSTFIQLFGMPIEKPIRNQKTVSTAEQRHHYSVSSNIACRKPSCTVESCSHTPALADMSQQNHTQMITTTDTCGNNTMSSNNFESFPFTNSTVLKQKSPITFTLLPNMDVSCRMECSSVPAFSVLCHEQWLTVPDCAHNALHDMQCISFTDAPEVPVSDLSDSAFKTERNMDAFKVNLVKSPQSKENYHIGEDKFSEYRNVDQMSQLQSGNNVHIRFGTINNTNVNCQDFPINIRSSIIQNVPFTDNRTIECKFSKEVNDNEQEETTFATSPHSPPKSIFLPCSLDNYSLPDIRSQLSKQSVYDKSNSSLKSRQSEVQNCLGHFNEPIHFLNQHGSDVKETYNSGSTNEAQAICLDNNRSGFNLMEREQCVSDFLKDNLSSHKDQEMYLVSCGLDCTLNDGHAGHLRESNGSNRTSFTQQKMFEAANNEVCNERKSFISKKPISWSVTCSDLTTSYNNTQRPLQVERDICSQEIQCKELKRGENHMNQSKVIEWLSDPLMTSTPCNPPFTETGSVHNDQLMPAAYTRDHRNTNKTSSASEVLLEMSILEKQREFETLVSNPEPTVCTQNVVLDLKSTPQIAEKLPEGTSRSSPDKKVASSALLPTSGNNVATNVSLEAHNAILYTPAQSVSSTETHPPSAYLNYLTQEKQVHGLDCRDTPTKRCPIACEYEIDMDRAERCNIHTDLINRLSTDNLNNCVHTETNIVTCSTTRKNMISASSQTTPKGVQDAACSPIKVFSMDGTHRHFKQLASNDTDADNSSRIYFLRPRNKSD